MIYFRAKNLLRAIYFPLWSFRWSESRPAPRYGTLFLPVERFPERGGMALTTLLVFISLYTDVSSSLPSTSHLKLIDVWFVYNILFLSLIIGTHLLACGSIQGTSERQWVVPVEKEGGDASSSREELILKVARITLGVVTLFLHCTKEGISEAKISMMIRNLNI